jgi:hypothetical protein
LAADPANAPLVEDLKKELYRLKKEVQDNDEFADRQPTDSSYDQGARPGKQAKGAKAKKGPAS